MKSQSLLTRKFYSFITYLTCISLISVSAQAQTNVIIGAGSASGTSVNNATGDPGPIYRSAASSAFDVSKYDMLFLASELSAIPVGATITKISWFKDNNGATVAPHAQKFDIYLKNSSLTTSLPAGTAFSTVTSGATLVYASTAQEITSAIGWVEFNLTTPFVYTGGALEVITDWDILNVSGDPTTAGFSWKRDPITHGMLGYAGSAQSTTLPNVRTVRAQTRFTYTFSSCSGTPNMPTIPSTVSLCQGQSYTFTPSGASAGGGITYTWQDSSAGGAWSTFSVTTTPNLNLPVQNVVGTKYFRLVTLCTNSGNSSISNISTFNVNQSPVVSASASSLNSCVGTGVTLTGTSDIPATFSWAPSASVSPTTGATVTANPALNSSVTYTMTATSTGGCTKTATVGPILGLTSPVITSVLASPNSICAGNTSTLSTTLAPAPSLPSNYSFASSLGTYTAISGTTATGAVGDDAVQSVPLGFTFNYNNASYTSAWLSTNGNLQLNSTASNAWTNTLATPPNPNFICPFWDDNNTATGSISYTTTGVAPNRVFTAQWTNVSIGGAGSTGNATNNFQVELHENGTIKFNYGSMTGANGVSGSIGISGNAGNFISVTPGATPTSSTTTANDNVTDVSTLVSGRVYTFTPPPPPVYSYNWQPAADVSAGSSNTIPEPVVDLTSSLQTTTFTVTVSNAGGCSTTGTVTVQLGGVGTFALTTPFVTVPSGQLNGVCQGSAVNLKDTMINGGSPFDWTLTYPDGTIYTVNTSSNSFDYTWTPTMTQSGVYTISVTDFCNQVSTATFQLNVNPLPNIQATSAQTLYCSSTPTLNATGGDSFTWVPGNLTGNSISPNITTSTTYTVTGADANGCTATSSILAQFGFSPTWDSVSVNPVTVCATNTGVTLSAQAKVIGSGPTPSPSTYCPVSHPTNGYALFTNVIFGSINNNTGVTNAGTVQYYPPSPTTTTTVVAGTSQNFSCTMGFNPGAFNSADAIISIWIDFNRDGIYQPTEWFQPSTNASSITNFPIAIPTSASPGATRMRLRSRGTGNPNGATDACTSFGSGECEEYEITILSQTSVGSFTWTNNIDPTVYTGATATTNPLTATTTFTVTATSTQGCTVTSTVIVNVGSALTVNPITSTLGNSMCGGLSNTLSIPVSGGGLPYSYSWTNSANSNVETTPTVVFNGNSTTTYTCVVTDACGSSSSQVYTINVNPAPTPVISAMPSNALICGTLNTVSLSVTGGDSFSWSPATGLNSTTGTSVTSNVTSTITYTVTATENVNNCTSTTVITVQYETAPTWSVTPNANPANVCNNGISVLSAQAAQIQAGPQTLPTGYCTAGAANTSDEEIFNVTLEAINNTTGCINPLVGTQGTGTGTPDLYSNFTGNSAFASLNAGTTYTFSVGIGTCGGNFASLTKIWIDYNRDGDFTDPGEEAYANTTAVNGPHTVTGSITVPSTATPGATVMRVRNAETTLPTGVAPCGAFSWGEVEDYRVNISNNVVIPGTATTWINSTNLSSGTGTLVTTNPLTVSEVYTVTATAPLGCTISSTVSVSVAVPISNFSIVSSTGTLVCENATVNLSTMFNGGSPAFNYVWTDLSNNTVVSTTATHSFVATSNASYSVVITDACGESATSSISFTLSPAPMPSVTPSSGLICSGNGPVSLTASGGSTYSWAPSTGLNATNVATVNANPTQTTTYTLTAADAIGCTATTFVTINVENYPTITSITASPSSVCVNNISTLTAVATQLGNGPQILPTGYCTAGAANAGDEEIFNVTLGAINNTTGCSNALTGTQGTGTGTPGLYADFTGNAAKATLLAGSNYTFSVGIGTCGGNFSSLTKIWIDYNRDGDFADPGEEVFANTTAINGPHTVTGNITVPANITPGLTRIRVRNAETSSPASLGSCGPLSWGEVEDYAANLIGLVPLSASQYTWADPNNLSSTTGSSVVTNQLATTETFTVTATGALGCATTSTVTVTVGQPFTSASITSSSGTNICLGETTTLTANFTGGSPSYSYTWFDPSVLPSSSNTIAVSPTTNTVYQVIIADACGFSTSATYSITVDPLPTVAISATSTLNCFSSGVTLTASGASTYTWSNGTTGTTNEINPTTTTIYSVVGTDANGCTGNSSIVIDGIDYMVTATNSGPVCPSGTVTLSVADTIISSGPQTLPTGYCAAGAANLGDEEILNVTFGATNNSTTCASPLNGSQGVGTGTPDLYADFTNNAALTTVAANSTFTFSVQIGTCGGNFGSLTKIWIDYNRDGDFTDAGEEVFSNTSAISGPHTVTGSITIPGNVVPGKTRLRVRNLETTSPASLAPCGSSSWGEVEDYSINLLGLLPITNSYTWSNGATGSTTTVTPTATTTYTVTSTAANGCSTTSVTTVTVYPTPIVTASASSTIVAAGGTTTLTAGGASTYQWSPTSDINGASNTATVIGQPSSIAGTSVDYMVVGTDANGCTGTSSVQVMVASAPTLTANGTNPLCNGTFGSIMAMTSGGVAPYAYTLNGTSASNPMLNLSAGSYTVEVTDALGQTSVTAVTLTDPPLLELNATATDAACIGGNGSINASTTGGTGTVTITVNMIPIASSYPTGTYTVQATDANGCTSTTVVTISVASNLALTASAADPLCAGVLGQLTYSASGGVTPYSYTVNGIASTSPSMHPSGSYTIGVTDAGGCTNSTVVSIGPNPPAIVFSSSVLKTNVVCPGTNTGTMQVSATGGTGSITYTAGSLTSTTGSFTGLTGGIYTVTATDANMCTITTTVEILQPAPIQFITPVIYQPSYCTNNDGILSVWANGGTGTKTYSIQPAATSNITGSFNNLASGVYTVTATDVNGCTTTMSYNIVATPVITVNTPTVVSTGCATSFTSTATVTATGGVPNLSYTIMPSATQSSPGQFSNLGSNTYTVTVKDSRNCTATVTFAATAPAPITFNPNVIMQPTCHGTSTGMMTISASGGSGTYTYSLVPANGMQPIPGTFINLPSAIYVVKATDANGCTKTQAVVLPQPAKNVFTSVVRTHPNCNGSSNGSISVTASGGVGSKTYSVTPSAGTVSSNVISGLPAGTYTVKVTDANGCTGTTTTTLTQPTAVSWVGVNQVHPTTTSLGSIIVSAVGGTGTKTYMIAPMAGTQFAPGTFNGLNAGTYTLTAKDANNCSITTSVTLTMTMIVVNDNSISVESVNNDDNEIRMHPNPTTGILNVLLKSNSEQNISIRVIDASGRRVMTVETGISVGENSIQVDLTELTPSNYFIQVVGEHDLKVNKLIQKN